MLTVTLAAMLARAANRRRGECTRRVGGVNHFLCKVAVSQQELRQKIRKWSENGIKTCEAGFLNLYHKP